jgi:hypothetical protein
VRKLGIDIEKKINAVYSKRHGGPYDRGSADSYYRRGPNPHYYLGDTYNSIRIDKKEMTDSEIAAYEAGYYDNEIAGDHKDY